MAKNVDARLAERRAWLVVGSLFATLFFVFGSGYNTGGVFFTPLLQHFGWSRAQVSLLQTTLALSAGVVVPLVGWLLDRLEARVVMVTGAGLTGIGFLLASRADAFVPMVVAYALIGVGLGAATLLPVSLVVANWFGAKRGLALGLAMGGTSVGGMVMTLVASRALEHGGWREGYLALALPIFVVVMPLVALTVRTRPPAGTASTVAEAARTLPGLEVKTALRVRSFWLIGLAQFFYSFAASGTNLHAIPYFMGIGYGAARAALFMSLVLGIAGAGKLVMGLLADRIGGRRALVLNFVLHACGMVMLLFAANPAVMAAFLGIYGLTVGAPLTLMPLVMADSFGLKRFGSLSGLLGLFNILGAAAGPVVAGRIFDLTSSYAAAFQIFTLALLLGAAATAGCLSLSAASRKDPAPVEGRSP
jgi:MFS family permease